MKTTNSHNSLDHKIDDLLASQPLKPSTDFTSRVLTAVNELPANKNRTKPLRQLLRFALPIAALILVAFTLAQLILTKPTANTAPTLSTADIQEIFLLEEGLSGLSQLQDDNLNSTDLQSILDTLYFEIES